MSENEELLVLEDVNAIEIFSCGGTAALLKAIRDKVINVVPDVSTAKGRSEIASRAHKVGKSKVVMENARKALKSGLKKQVDAIDAEGKIARENLEALKIEVREPLTIWEDAEAKKTAIFKERLDALEFSLDNLKGMNITDIEILLDQSQHITTNSGTFGEFKEQAEAAKPIFIEKLTAYLDELVEKKKQADELIKLQKEKEERERLEREEAIRKEAAAKAEAETQAAIAREEATKKQAAQDAKDAEDRENKGIEEAKARLKAAEVKAAEDQKKAEEKAEEYKKQAFIDAEANANAAIEKERQRVANEQEATEKAAAKKAANKKHRKAINEAALASFIDIGIDEETAKNIINAIFEKKIANITINYS